MFNKISIPVVDYTLTEYFDKRKTLFHNTFDMNFNYTRYLELEHGKLLLDGVSTGNKTPKAGDPERDKQEMVDELVDDMHNYWWTSNIAFTLLSGRGYYWYEGQEPVYDFYLHHKPKKVAQQEIKNPNDYILISRSDQQHNYLAFKTRVVCELPYTEQNGPMRNAVIIPKDKIMGTIEFGPACEFSKEHLHGGVQPYYISIRRYIIDRIDNVNVISNPVVSIESRFAVNLHNVEDVIELI